MERRPHMSISLGDRTFVFSVDEEAGSTLSSSFDAIREMVRIGTLFALVFSVRGQERSREEFGRDGEESPNLEEILQVVHREVGACDNRGEKLTLEILDI